MLLKIYKMIKHSLLFEPTAYNTEKKALKKRHHKLYKFLV